MTLAQTMTDTPTPCTDLAAAEEAVDLLREEHAQVLQGEHRLEALPEGLHLPVDALVQQPVGQQLPAAGLTIS